MKHALIGASLLAIAAAAPVLAQTEIKIGHGHTTNHSPDHAPRHP